MSGDLKIENILMQVRSKLQEDGVKLWLSPYYEESIGPIDEMIEKLATDYCQVLNVPLNYCQAAISELQCNALDKLRARAEFAETGLATIKVRAPNQVGGTRLITINVKLSETGRTLQELVGKELELECPLRVKLISAGRVINSHQILSEQKLQNNQQILAVILETSDSQAVNAAESAAYDRVQKARDDAQLLINQKRHEFMQMEDQKGNAIHLPPQERASLMMALAMHEKAKVELKKENYAEALLLLLDADNEFNQCGSNLLQNVDNYALLNLDIAWCYLCLKSVQQLPDAENRLRICETNFKRSYGQDLDRVMLLKGSTGNEKALIMRLHLLQAIVLFHQNRRLEAQSLLMLAETELNQLKISDESVTALIDMGYTMSEARIGLRACGGDIDRTISYIIELRSSREEARKRTRKERRLMKKVGESKDKTWINPRSLTDLVDMGFPSELCVAALQLSDNNVADAVNMLQNNKTALQQKVSEDFIPDTKIVDEMTKMGFHPEIINMSLRHVSNNMNEAVDMLLRMQGEGTYDNLLTSICGSTSAAATSTIPAVANAVNILKANVEEATDAMAAFERFSEGVSANEDDYLDLSLVMEENFIAQYKNFF
ncbi:NEDD8 ultimate buster 1-like [Bradysia coprophila]|uniref:NEDD8 ultimate buster 1-like n=1 Tax=Bradysia coprophila TaxID=38358 RepID=UPI00187D77FD|nr:NEDD8 ultimate buster 1-like [Bradysia coprophila]